jgi:putative membrane protein
MRSSPTCSRSESRRPGVRLIGLASASWLAVVPLPAAAQMGNPAFMVPETGTEANGQPAPGHMNHADVLFVQLLGEGGLAEVSLGELAGEKAKATAVQEFGERMAADHGAANEDLAGIAAEAGMVLPSELSAEHAMLRSRLEGMEPATFDLTYMRAQIVDHQKTALLMQWEIDSGQQVALQRFAAANLPAVLEHLALARGIVDQLSQEQVAEAAPAQRP